MKLLLVASAALLLVASSTHAQFPCSLAACQNPGATCGFDFLCNEPTSTCDSATKRCVARKTPGETCVAGDKFHSPADVSLSTIRALASTASVSLSSLQGLSAGQVSDLECLNGKVEYVDTTAGGMPCNSDLHCGTRSCVSFTCTNLTDGQNCTKETQCHKDSACWLGVCVPRLAAGAVCDNSVPCPRNHVCDMPLSPNSAGTCKLVLSVAAQQPCEVGIVCKSGSCTQVSGNELSAAAIDALIQGVNWTQFALVNVTSVTSLTPAQALSQYNVSVAATSAVAVIEMNIDFASFDQVARDEFNDRIATTLGVDPSRFTITFVEGSVVAIIEIKAAPRPIRLCDSTGAAPAALLVPSKTGSSTCNLLALATGGDPGCTNTSFCTCAKGSNGLTNPACVSFGGFLQYAMSNATLGCQSQIAAETACYEQNPNCVTGMKPGQCCCPEILASVTCQLSIVGALTTPINVGPNSCLGLFSSIPPADICPAPVTTGVPSAPSGAPSGAPGGAGVVEDSGATLVASVSLATAALFASTL